MWSEEEVPETDGCGMNTSDDDKSDVRVNIKRRAQLRIRAQKRRRLIIYLSVCFLLAVAYFVRLVRLNGEVSSFSGLQHRRAYLRGSNSLIYRAPFNENFAASNAIHLIMVAGHSVLIGNSDNVMDESAWHLLDYQRGQGLPEAIVAHIVAGISEASRDPLSLLVFSGGETRGDGTAPYSESSSYFRAADALGLWVNEAENSGTSDTEIASNARARTVTEEFATDSFENMLFSICRFKEVTGHYPQYITLVSFSFKEKRFVELHASALQWPKNRLKYIGKDASPSSGFDLERSMQGEQENAVRHFKNDPYGCHTEELREKRKLRNPFKRIPPYELSCPEISELLRWCGPELYPKKKLPWSDLN